MREIKFRAYASTDDGIEMVYLGKAECDNGLWFDAPKHIDDYESAIMQYTGLKDKNGKEIYDGDIVRWGLGFTGSYDVESWHRYAVVQLNPDIQFKIVYYIDSKTGDKKPSDDYVFNYGGFAYKKTNLYLEVIGNIHENPELLQGDKNG